MKDTIYYQLQIRVIYYKGKNDATFVRTLSYAKGFAQNGASVKLSFLLPPERGWSLDKYDRMTVDNIYEHWPKIFSKFQLSIYLYSICKLLKSIKQDDIIYFSLPYLNTLVANRAKRKNARFFMEFTEIPYYKIKPGFIRYYISTSQFLAAKKADFVCVISKGLADFYNKKGIERLYVVNMFVDIKRFLSATDDSELGYNKELITYCGSLSSRKDGVDILIKSFSIVHETHPNARLRIIGSSSEPIMNTLRELTQSLGVTDYVEFTGKVSFEYIPNMLKQSGILALARPSSNQAKFGFPTKLGEYLCTKRPVVITRTGEIDHFLKDGESCVFAKPDQVDDFALKLNWCLDNYTEASIIGQNGCRVACDSFSAINESKKVLDIILNHT